jgi:hypothetical protein
VAADEVLECRQQLVGMVAVAAQNCPIYVIGDHGADLATPFGLTEQTLRQSRRMNVGYALMLSECSDLFRGQAGQRDAVLQGNHGVLHPEEKGVPSNFFLGLTSLTRKPAASHIFVVRCSIDWISIKGGAFE